MNQLAKNGLQVTANLNRLFPQGFPEYTSHNNNVFFSRPNPASSVRGVTLPENTLVAQTRAGTRTNRLYRNASLNDLPDGIFLYMIEVTTTKPYKYYQQFIKVEDKLELGTKHFQIASKIPGRTILAAGELRKEGNKIIWNLGSGTYTRNFINQYGGNAERFKAVVRNSFKISSPGLRKKYTEEKLLNVPPTKLRKLLQAVNEGKAGLYKTNPENSNNYESDENLGNVLREKHKERLAQGLTTVNTSGRKSNVEPPSVSKKPRTNS
jgi:hypothetical protein